MKKKEEIFEEFHTKYLVDKETTQLETIFQAMQAYATQCCEQQRIACAENVSICRVSEIEYCNSVTSFTKMDDNYYDIDKQSILETPIQV